MTINIPHPKLLLMLLALVGFGWVAYTAVGDDGNDALPPPLDGAYPVPGKTRELPTVSEAEVEVAKEVAAAHPELGHILADQDEELIYTGPGLVQGNKIGATLVFQWEEPVTMTGPWVDYFPSCDRIVNSNYTAHDVTRVTITVDAATREVSSFFPMNGERSSDTDFVLPPECIDEAEDDD